MATTGADYQPPPTLVPVRSRKRKDPRAAALKAMAEALGRGLGARLQDLPK